MKSPLQNSLEARVNMAKMPLNSQLKFTLDKSTPWLAELLTELNENATEKTPEAWLAETEFTLTIELVKHFKGELGEYLLARGHVDTTYATECIRTLKTMKESLAVDFNVAFVSEAVLAMEEYAETGEMWLDGETRDLYVHKRNTADLAEMLHEQVYMNHNQYPRLDADSPLDAGLETDKPRQ